MSERQEQQCHFTDSNGKCCNQPDLGRGFCFWHDPKVDKSGMDLTKKLEDFAEQGGVLQGLQLKRANLQNLNLVNYGAKDGFDLSGSDFYRADLSGAHLFNVVLNYGSLMKANMFDVNLHCASLIHTNMLGTKLYNAKIDNVNFGDQLMQECHALDAEIQGDHAKRIDFLEQAEEIYRNLRKAAEAEGLFEMAGKYLYKELLVRRQQMPKYSIKRATSKLVDVLCGYGEKPENTVLFSMLLIVICAGLYYFLGVAYGDETIKFDPRNEFWENMRYLFLSLYYSVVTFTTLGYGDIAPYGISRLIAALEAFIGSFTLALFVVVFVKRMTR